MKRRIHALAAVCVLMSMEAKGQVPSLMNYQGRIVQGTNLVNGTVAISLRLFDAATLGNLLYEDSNSVVVVDGLYSTFIGDNTISGNLQLALTNATVFIEVAVNGSSLSPRERLASVAYALGAWGVAGNSGTSTGVHFIGTTDNRPFEIRTLNQRVARFDTATNSAGALIPNVVLGHSANLASNGTAFGSVIGGGGNSPNPQIVGRAYDTVAGGVGNKATGGDSTVVGGRRNVASELQAYVGGGSTNTANSPQSTIGGGLANTIDSLSSFAVIGGGRENQISSLSSNSVVAGGYRNQISGGSPYGTIGGGQESSIVLSPAALATENATIGGGFQHRLAASWGTIAGGRDNEIKDESFSATIGGGQFNEVSSNSYGSTISGGDLNVIEDQVAAGTIGGGRFNRIGRASNNPTIAGGDMNSISNGAFYATISGGQGNHVAADAANAVIGGGSYNLAGGIGSTVPGGQNNDAANTLSFAAGNRAKAAHVGSFVWGDASDEDIVSTNENSVTMRAVGGVRMVTSTGLLSGAELASGSGSWTSLSDVNAKKNFAPVDSREILNRLIGMPIHQWSYKAQDDSIRHIGPTAQDFHAAFGVGDKPNGITTVDADGVALAAIQALARENEEMRIQNTEFRSQNAEMRAELEALKVRLEAMEMR